MAEQGLDVTNLAKKLNRSEAGIRQLFKRGYGRPGTIKQIADALGVPMKDLLKPTARRTRKAA
jgi:hypothetical protein